SREPARQDLSTLRASRNVLVDSQSDCEDPPRSPVTLLGCGLVISSVTPYSDWLRAFDPTCPLVIAGPGPVGALA
ncbi:MAG: hypothetical protein ACLP41_12555, partial [Acidimicrobiales bacterium]